MSAPGAAAGVAAGGAAGGDAGGDGAPRTSGVLADVLPAAVAALGAPLRPTGWALPAAPRVCVLLVDGLGERLLAARAGHAPHLRALAGAPASRVLRTTHPSTTATAMGSLGTGLAPGTHGMVGYQVLDPASGALLNELSWELVVPGGGPAGRGGALAPDPRRWQREPTVFEHAAAGGVAVTRVGPGHFDGSGLTEAALRGGRYRAATSLQARVDAAAAALRDGERSLVYVYWGEVDKVGHGEGWASDAWARELEAVDAAVAQLVARLPRDAVLVVTADHGMVDVPAGARTDLARDAELAAGVALTAGEPRAPLLHCAPGATADVLATWRARLGASADVLATEEAVEEGWFGPVADHVRPRLGDVVVAAREAVSVHDSRVQRPALAGLVGMHGARTPAEVRVPLLVAAGDRVDVASGAAEASGGGPRG